jgi:type IV pilus assembly protein PilV
MQLIMDRTLSIRKFRQPSARPDTQSGVSLLESMIAIVLVSLGLLALVGLLVRSSASLGSATSRDRAGMLAASMLDQLRVNTPKALKENAAYVNATITSGNCVTDRTSPDPINRWRGEIACALPSGAGAVDVDPSSRKASITIRWDDSRTVGGSATQTLIMETRL